LLLFVPFFTVGNYDKLFFTGPGELLGFIVQGGNLKGCTLIFYFFIVEGEGFSTKKKFVENMKHS
jgi:hypothetical protein